MDPTGDVWPGRHEVGVRLGSEQKLPATHCTGGNLGSTHVVPATHCTGGNLGSTHVVPATHCTGVTVPGIEQSLPGRHSTGGFGLFVTGSSPPGQYEPTGHEVHVEVVVL